MITKPITLAISILAETYLKKSLKLSILIPTKSNKTDEEWSRLKTQTLEVGMMIETIVVAGAIPMGTALHLGLNEASKKLFGRDLVPDGFKEESLENQYKGFKI